MKKKKKIEEIKNKNVIYPLGKLEKLLFDFTRGK